MYSQMFGLEYVIVILITLYHINTACLDLYIQEDYNMLCYMMDIYSHSHIFVYSMKQ